MTIKVNIDKIKHEKIFHHRGTEDTEDTDFYIVNSAYGAVNNK